MNDPFLIGLVLGSFTSFILSVLLNKPKSAMLLFTRFFVILTTSVIFTPILLKLYPNVFVSTDYISVGSASAVVCLSLQILIQVFKRFVLSDIKFSNSFLSFLVKKKEKKNSK